jgi:hypothetical protein
MMAPAGHVTVTVAGKPLVAEPHAVEYKEGDRVTLPDRVADAVTLAPKVGVREDVGDTEDDLDGDEIFDADTLDDGLRDRVTEGEDATERDGVTLRPKDGDGDIDGVALTILHCTYRMYVVAAPHPPPVGAVSRELG